VLISVTIKDTSGAGRAFASVTLDGIDDRITLRDLVRTRVREEVARYNAAQGEYLTGLVMPDGLFQGHGQIRWSQQAQPAAHLPRCNYHRIRLCNQTLSRFG
jgi:hypothetical protein